MRLSTVVIRRTCWRKDRRLSRAVELGAELFCERTFIELENESWRRSLGNGLDLCTNCRTPHLHLKLSIIWVNIMLTGVATTRLCQIFQASFLSIRSSLQVQMGIDEILTEDWRDELSNFHIWVGHVLGVLASTHLVRNASGRLNNHIYKNFRILFRRGSHSRTHRLYRFKSLFT